MTKINEENFYSLVKRYKNCHPLFVLRTLEKTKSLGKTFDLLEDFCGKNNLSWDNEGKVWKEVELTESSVQLFQKNVKPSI